MADQFLNDLELGIPQRQILGSSEPISCFVPQTKSNTDVWSITSGIKPAEPLSWYALYCRHQHEKLVADKLLATDVVTFLPTRKVTKFWSDRKKIVEQPLFGGYVFVKMELTERSHILEKSKALGFVGGMEPWEIPEREIDALQKIVTEDMAIDPFPYLTEGRWVRIKRGPLKGVEGFVVKKLGIYRLVITIEMMKQSVAVEIDPCLVETK